MRCTMWNYYCNHQFGRMILLTVDQAPEKRKENMKWTNTKWMYKLHWRKVSLTARMWDLTNYTCPATHRYTPYLLLRHSIRHFFSSFFFGFAFRLRMWSVIQNAVLDECVRKQWNHQVKKNEMKRKKKKLAKKNARTHSHVVTVKLSQQQRQKAIFENYFGVATAHIYSVHSKTFNFAINSALVVFDTAHRIRSTHTHMVRVVVNATHSLTILRYMRWTILSSISILPYSPHSLPLPPSLLLFFFYLI